MSKNNGKNIDIPIQENNRILILEETFYAYHKKLVYFSYQFVLDKVLAEDIVQEVFIKFSENSILLSQDQKLIQNYLYRAVKNRSINTLRDIKVRDRVLGTVDKGEWDDETIIDRIIQSEVMYELYSAFESLPEKCEVISRMGYLEGKSNQEIAKELGVSINTVKTQKQRGLKLLRLKLNPEALCLLTLLIT